MDTTVVIVYLLCLAASILCAALLLRAYARSRARLLLWSSVCFTLLAVNSMLVVLDMVVFPAGDLRLARNLATFIGLCFLIYGFVFEVEK
jgi:hypothetical protein